MSDVHALSSADLQREVDRVLVGAAEVSPPCSLIEATLQAQLLARLGALRDEVFRRAVAARAPSAHLSRSRGRKGRRRAA